jgi:NADH dehydrogenase
MTNSNVPHIIIIGAGFGGLRLIQKLKNKSVDVTVFDKNNYHLFQPLLYQVASGGLSPDSIAYPIRKITGKTKNILFRMAEVLSVTPVENKITTSIGDFTYDYLVIATGSQTNFYGNVELEKNCLELKSINNALDIRSDILQEFEKAITAKNNNDAEAALNFVVVGGGPTGVELAGALAEMKRKVIPADYRNELDKNKMHVYLIEAGNEVVNMFDASLSKTALHSLNNLGVKVLLSTRVEKYDGKILVLNNGMHIRSDTVIWAAGVKGKLLNGIPAASISPALRYKVNGFLQIENYNTIYALGDIAFMTEDKKYPHGHPMVAPVAMQQADLVAQLILKRGNQKAIKPFSYFDKGSMATIGRHKAVFQAFGIKLSGIIAWFAWMALHLMLLVSFRNKLVVFVNWMWNYITYQRHIRIIIRPFKKND